jgi:hypothetical protein
VGLDSQGLQILLADDSVRLFKLAVDRAAGRLTLTEVEGDHRVYPLAYRLVDDERLTLEGTLREEAVAVRLRRLPSAAFPLLQRRFRWVTETPYNR